MPSGLTGSTVFCILLQVMLLAIPLVARRPTTVWRCWLPMTWRCHDIRSLHFGGSASAKCPDPGAHLTRRASPPAATREDLTPPVHGRRLRHPDLFRVV